MASSTSWHASRGALSDTMQLACDVGMHCVDTGMLGTSDTGMLGTSDTGMLGTSDTGMLGTSDKCNMGMSDTGIL